MNGKTAVVFSAGMMFGAYQAGVWKALAGVLRPDAVVGASSGALNAWAVAGGCGPDALREMWLNEEIAAVTTLRAPLPHLRMVPTGGVDAHNVADFFNAGCVAVGVGSSLVASKILQEAAWPVAPPSASRRPLCNRSPTNRSRRIGPESCRCWKTRWDT